MLLFDASHTVEKLYGCSIFVVAVNDIFYRKIANVTTGERFSY